MYPLPILHFQKDSQENCHFRSMFGKKIELHLSQKGLLDLRESTREVYPSGLAVLENKEKLQENVKNHAKLLKITVWHDF